MEQSHEKAEAGIKFTKFEMTTDGTAAGTKILLNGKAISNLNYVTFCWWNGDTSPSVSFATRDPKREAGTMSETSYYSLVPPSTGADASKDRADASFQKQPVIPAEALKGEERQNIYRLL